MATTPSTNPPPPPPAASCWAENLRLLPISSTANSDSEDADADAETTEGTETTSTAFTVLSFNVLAEAYLTPRSHPHLPAAHAAVAFHPPKRRELLLRILRNFAGAEGAAAGEGEGEGEEGEGEGEGEEGGEGGGEGEGEGEGEKAQERFDLLCLQELDRPLLPLVLPLLAELGYGCVHALEEESDDEETNGAEETTKPRTKNSAPPSSGGANGGGGGRPNPKSPRRGAGAGGRSRPKSDTCAIFYCRSKFRLIDSRVIEFDDLADANDGNGDGGNGDGGNGAGGGGGGQHPPPRTKSGHSRARRGRGGGTAAGPLSGMAQSFRRRNRGLVAVLEIVDDDPSSPTHRHRRRMCVATAHLYWHPGYEYVKLCQAKHWTDKVEEFAAEHAALDDGHPRPSRRRLPVIFCGDLNSRPGSAVHAFLTRGGVDARAVAPWNPRYYENLEVEAGLGELEVADGKGSRRQTAAREGVTTPMEDPHREDDPAGLPPDADHGEKDEHTYDAAAQMQNLQLQRDVSEASTANDADDDHTAMALTPGNGLKKIQAPMYRSREIHDTTPNSGGDAYSLPRYLCDYTLNRFTRWLRILGVDAALETAEEEKERTAHNDPSSLFRRCRTERRTLLTTSKNLLLRKDCPPGAYLIHPKKTADLEKALVQLFLTHGVVLRPSEFVTRCVVCNGTIYTVADEEDRARIFEANGCPDLQTDLSVYACNGCGQGYWWCEEIPTSSATRVKNQAAHLFRQCLRGGVPYEGELRMFDFVDPAAEHKIGKEEGTLVGQGRPEAPMEGIIDWLKDKELGHSFELRSAYALMDSEGDRAEGEILPFTNVTADFVGLLDYIFFETAEFDQTHRLEVPTSFRTLNGRGEAGGHLLPSDKWPSDHLALGARFVFKTKTIENAVKEEEKPAASIPGAGWASPAPNHVPGSTKCECGCVPNIPSLFEMAELRKQARLKAEKERRGD